MENEMKITFDTKDNEISDLERLLIVMKEMSFKTCPEKEILLMEVHTNSVNIYPESNQVRYIGIEKNVYPTEVGAESMCIVISSKTKTEFYNFHYKPKKE